MNYLILFEFIIRSRRFGATNYCSPFGEDLATERVKEGGWLILPAPLLIQTKCRAKTTLGDPVLIRLGEWSSTQLICLFVAIKPASLAKNSRSCMWYNDLFLDFIHVLLKVNEYLSSEIFNFSYQKNIYLIFVWKINIDDIYFIHYFYSSQPLREKIFIFDS